MNSTDYVSSVLLLCPRENKKTSAVLSQIFCLETKGGEIEKITVVHYSCSTAPLLPRKRST